MKRNICLLGVGCVVATSLLFIGSCSTDVEEVLPDDLSIENQIPRVKRTTPELNDDGIPVYQDECALYALTLIKGAENGGYGSNSSAEYYNKLRDYAMNELDYKGGPMTESMVEKIGQHFGLISRQHKFSRTSEQELLSRDLFFFINGGRIKMVNVPGHTGMFLSYDSNSGKIIYKDATGTQPCNINDVISVYYK